MDEEISIVVHEKCTKLNVVNVVKNVKFLSSRQMTLMETHDQFTAKIVLEKDVNSKNRGFLESDDSRTIFNFIFLIFYYLLLSERLINHFP